MFNDLCIGFRIWKWIQDFYPRSCQHAFVRPPNLRKALLWWFELRFKALGACRFRGINVSQGLEDMGQGPSPAKSLWSDSRKFELKMSFGTRFVDLITQRSPKKGTFCLKPRYLFAARLTAWKKKETTWLRLAATKHQELKGLVFDGFVQICSNAGFQL